MRRSRVGRKSLLQRFGKRRLPHIVDDFVAAGALRVLKPQRLLYIDRNRLASIDATGFHRFQ